MRFHNSRIRTKVTALLVSLVALWGFAAWVTLQEGLNVLWVTTLSSGVSGPSEPLLLELQRERKLTVLFLGDVGSGTEQRTGLDAQRARTEAASLRFQRLATGSDVRRAASDTLNRRIAETVAKLQALRAGRKTVDARQIDRGRAATAYTDVIQSFYPMYDSMAALDDKEFARDTRTFIEFSRARELLAQEDAFAAGTLGTGRFLVTDRAQFGLIVGAQRFVMSEALEKLPSAERKSFEQLMSSEQFRRLRTLEDRLVHSGRTDLAAVDAEQWKSAADFVLNRLQTLVVVEGGQWLVQRATPIAVGVVARLALAGGLGLLAVIASIVLSITTARALVRRLEELRTAALELAARRLPGVVERLGRGDDVDVAAEAPPLAVGNDAIGQVGQAFNTVQETAIRVAVEQAELRRSYRGILLSLARRTQSLVHRQLTILDAMERRETEPGELADLFRVDHLATRMRRNAENLIVLSGASPGRAWRRSVPMVDVVRGALAEVEDYTQVTLMPMGEAELAGRAIGDVIHLLAELIENAVSFSPPYASVHVSGQEVAKGYVVEIEDRGLGMTPEDLASANDRIADPPEFKLTGTPRLGLYVVSRLASRHQIQVTLKASPYGGTTVIVLIPRELINGEVDTDMDLGTDSDALPGRQLPPGTAQERQGRHRTTGEFPVQAGGPGGAGPFLLTAVPRWEDDERSEPAPAVPGQGEAAPEREPSSPPRSPSADQAWADQEASAQQGASLFEQASAAEPEDYTPSGLPRRVAQAHLAPELRREPPPAPSTTAEDDDELSPEDLRRLMGSFQSGTERGRSEAARLPRRLDPDPDPGDEPMRYQ